MNSSGTLAFVFLFVVYACQSQEQSTCEKSVKYKSLEKLIPKEICLPSNDFEFQNISITDIDENGLTDFIGEWKLKKLKDGDTIRISIYLQVDSGKYELVSTYVNLLPIFFKEYNLEYKVQDSILNEFKSRYPGYPNQELKFDENEFTIYFEAGVGSHYFLQYRYDPQLKDWFLERRIYYEEDFEGRRTEISNDSVWDQKLSLRKFSYFDYF